MLGCPFEVGLPLAPFGICGGVICGLRARENCQRYQEGTEDAIHIDAFSGYVKVGGFRGWFIFFTGGGYPGIKLHGIYHRIPVPFRRLELMRRKTSDFTDVELLAAFRASGDRSMLGVILERYTLLLLGVCMKYLKDEEAARDMVQQVHLKALTEWEKYPVEYVKSWLYMVARNECLMRLRSSGRVVADIEVVAARLTDEETTFDLLREKESRLDSMEAAIGLLPEQQRECIERFYLNDQSYRQISESTGYSIKEVKSHLQNGKRNLRIIIEKKEQRDGR